jgi:hypothetical protein
VPRRNLYRRRRRAERCLPAGDHPGRAYDGGRQLDEALTAGPDPLHLAAVFGIDDETAIKYAAAARHLLASAAEDQPPR